MTITQPISTCPTSLPVAEAHIAPLLLAAEAVLAYMHPRAPLRLIRVSLFEVPYITYHLAPDPYALALNRGLREEVILVALARTAMIRLLGLTDEQLAAEGWRAYRISSRQPEVLLAAALLDPEEQAVLEAHLVVLEARARAALRRFWAEVKVVAAGLSEHGTLDAQAIAHRITCAGGIRQALLN